MNAITEHATPARFIAIRPRVPAWIANLALAGLLVGLWPINRLLVDQIDPYFLLIATTIGVSVILATSLNLVIGISGQFSLGHAAFMAIGAYTTGIILRHYKIVEPAHGAFQLAAAGEFAGAILLGALFAAIAGLFIGIPTLRLRGDYLAIATLGFGEILFVAINNTENIGPFMVGGSSGLYGVPIYRDTRFFWVWGFAIVCIVCTWRIVYSSRGKAFLALREDEIAAAAMGVDTTWYKVAAFVIGAFFAGIAGGLASVISGNLDPGSYRFIKSVEIVVMVVLGGSGSITGVILAAALLTMLPEGLRFLKEATGPAFPADQLRMIIYSLTLILLMILRPTGLLGRRELFPMRRRFARTAAGGTA